LNANSYHFDCYCRRFCRGPGSTARLQVRRDFDQLRARKVRGPGDSNWRQHAAAAAAASARDAGTCCTTGAVSPNPQVAND
jgi:hypothetical protein